MDTRVDRLLRRSEVEHRVGLKRSSLYDLMSRGQFPRPVRIGRRAVAWREADILAWLDQLPVAE